MSKGPYFEFDVSKDSKNSIIFLFSPGNTSDHVFESTKNAMISVFKNRYQNNYTDYIIPIKNKDSIDTIGIYQTKVLGIINAILTIPKFYGFKVVVNGLNKDMEPETVVLTSWDEDKEKAKSVIPYHNKNNNDMTVYGDHNKKFSNSNKRI